MKKLIIASQNKGKIREISRYLESAKLEIVSPDENFGEIEENGSTFEENAVHKAKETFARLGIMALADDSGLEVDHLKGRPGVYSARYAGENATYLDNCLKLLEELKGVPLERRTARFRCILALYDGKSSKIFDGVTEGHILEAMRGNEGFGYDPLFLPKGFTRTYAELDLATKNLISHRGKALKKAREYLKKL